MLALHIDDLEFADAWQDDEPDARWRSASGHGPSLGASASGSSVIELEPGCGLPRHTDSAEETIVVLAGLAEVEIDGERERVGPGDLAVVPKDVEHEVRNAGDEPCRFAAVYAEPDVVTTYLKPVQPDGERARHTVS